MRKHLEGWKHTAKEAAQPTFSQKRYTFSRFWDPFWLHFGVQNRLKNWSPPKQGGFWAPWGSPGCFQGSFWVNSGRLLEASGVYFEGSVGHFGGIFEVQQQQKKQKEAHQTKAQKTTAQAAANSRKYEPTSAKNNKY